MTIIDTSHPFYRPLWRRILIVAFCVAWCLFEIVETRDITLIVLTGALSAYTAWTLLVTYRPTPDTSPVAKE